MINFQDDNLSVANVVYHWLTTIVNLQNCTVYQVINQLLELIVHSEVRGTTLQKLIVATQYEVRSTTLAKLIVSELNWSEVKWKWTELKWEFFCLRFRWNFARRLAMMS